MTTNQALRHGMHIRSVNVDPRLRVRVPTGVDFFDDALGYGGFVPSNVMMLTGDPGIGKTTLCLQIADSLVGAGHACLFNSNEQAPENLKLMTERMSLEHGFYIGNDTNALKLLANANAIANNNPDRQMFILLDSLPDMFPNAENDEGSENGRAVAVARMLRAWAKMTYGIVIFINHVTKGGHFVGKNTILHEIDCHAMAYFDREKRSPTFNERIFKMGKNRWGTSGVTSILKMTETGLVQTGKLELIKE